MKMKLIIRLVITIILGIATINAMAIDYSNLDLRNFKFFRYPKPNTDPTQQHQQPNIIENGANHIKAVYKYFKGMLLGNDWLDEEQTHIFDPDTGKRNAHSFYKKFGYRGEKLIELLGRGYPRDQLRYLEAVDRNYIKN